MQVNMYLVVFDRRREVRWDERLYEKEVKGTGGRRTWVFRA
jgi:hypothetical protein